MKEGTNEDNVEVGISWYKKGLHDTVRDKVVQVGISWYQRDFMVQLGIRWYK